MRMFFLTRSTKSHLLINLGQLSAVIEHTRLSEFFWIKRAAVVSIIAVAGTVAVVFAFKEVRTYPYSSIFHSASLHTPFLLPHYHIYLEFLTSTVSLFSSAVLAHELPMPFYWPFLPHTHLSTLQFMTDDTNSINLIYHYAHIVFITTFWSPFSFTAQKVRPVILSFCSSDAAPTAPQKLRTSSFRYLRLPRSNMAAVVILL